MLTLPPVLFYLDLLRGTEFRSSRSELVPRSDFPIRPDHLRNSTTAQTPLECNEYL